MDFLSAFQSFGHDDAQNHYQEVYHSETQHHQGSLGHEVLAGAAGFAAMKAYESHLRASGQQPTHSLMKEILAGIAAAEVDKLVETKGLDYIDRNKAKKLAEKQAQELAERRYGGGTGYEYVQGQGPEWGMQNHPSYAPLPPGYYPPPFAPAQYPPYGGQPGYQPAYPQGYPGYAPSPGEYQEGYRDHEVGRHNHRGLHRGRGRG